MSTNIAWIICSPLIFMQEFELTPIQYGLTQILTCLGFILGSITINQLITVYSKEKLLSTGKWMLSLTMISTSILVFLPKTLYLLIGISFLITYFFGFTSPVISRIVMSSYRLKKRSCHFNYKQLLKYWCSWRYFMLFVYLPWKLPCANQI